MTTEQSPLLSPRDRPDDETTRKKEDRASRFREIGFFLWALFATAAVIVLAVWAQHNHQVKSKPNAPASKRNLVFMVSDGMGPASLSLTRSYRQYVEGLPIDDVLVLDKHFWGSSRTLSSNSLVTDSAAGATAFACGKKSYNGAVGVTPDYEPCGTVLEAAKRAGYYTGLVVTTDIVDATPACFSSHVVRRLMEDDIALQQIGEGVLGRQVDLIMGGGRCFFLPNTTEGSCRADDVDVVKIAKEKHGWGYTDNRAGFDALKGGDKVDLPFLGLFASTDFPFAIDRQNHTDSYPTLVEMAKTALRALEKATADSDKGFFLMIEGSRIDHAGHYNDPVAQVREVLEYDAAFKAVLDFIEESDTETVLVATSDHETGGLSTALQEPGHLPVYNWYPKALAKAKSSTEYLARKYLDHLSKLHPSTSKDSLKKWINEELIVPGLGITDATDAELSLIAKEPVNALVTMCDMISLRAHVAWGTRGHSAVDVNIYSSGGPGTEKIRGNIENIEIGKFLGEYLKVDVEEITEELKEKMEKHDIKMLEPQALEAKYRGGVRAYHDTAL